MNMVISIILFGEIAGLLVLVGFFCYFCLHRLVFTF